MKRIFNVLRIAGHILILFIAAFAVGLTGHFLPVSREPYENKRVTTEQVDKKREDEETEI